jgi:peptidoglycan/LPS O-acetylase OafA/YrhL
MQKETGYQYHGIYRFFLSLMVLWSHSLSLFIPELKIANFQIGNVAVSSFFLLSGYLMNSSIQNWYIKKPINFILNRYLRISPPLFIASILSITIHVILNSKNIILIDGTALISNEFVSKSNIIYTVLTPFYPFNYIIYKIFFQNTVMNYTFVAYSWAIFIELIFYWLIFFAYKYKIKKFIVFFSTILFFMALDKLYLHNFNFLNNISTINIFQWAPHFILGTLLSSFNEKNKILTVLFGILSIIQLKYYAHEDYIYVILFYLLINTIAFSSILKSTNNDSLKKYFDKQLGTLSYPIYINQYSLSILLFSLLYLNNINLSSYSLFERFIYYICYNTLIIILSKLLILLTDYFTDNLRNKLRGKVL